MPDPAALVYPPTRRDDVVDDYHGTPVADPWRWLEDPDAPETRAWIDAQNRLTEGWLAGVPARERIRQRLTALWDHPRRSVATRRGRHLFWYRNDGLQAQPVLVVAESEHEPGRVLIDPNTLSDDGAVSLAGAWFSRDGARVVYALSEAGTDWRVLRVRDVATGEDLADEVRWVKFSSVAWTHDGAGFFYAAYDPPEGEVGLAAVNLNNKLFHHRLGAPQADDTLICARPDQPRWGFDPRVTDDGRLLVISVWESSEPRNRLMVRDLTTPDAPVVELIMANDAGYSLVGNDGPVLWLQTDLDAPNDRVIAVDLRDPARERWSEVIPEQPWALQAVTVVGGRLVARYLEHAHAKVRILETDGRLVADVALPGLGTITALSGRPADPDATFSFTTFTDPGAIWRLDVATAALTPVWRTPVEPMDPADWVTEQVFVTSRDGARVPMFLVHHRDVKPGAEAPTWLYGYGGFRISVTPTYSAVYRVWLELGGVLAVANLRGGGEYGAAWHDAGRLANKQNTFDDFHAAAEWLVAQGWTSPRRLAIGGRSNGGLLVGAAMTQRPELYGAAVPGVGVMDMLRFHRFTIGWAWTTDYGSSDDPEQFGWLYAYSPLHNLREGTRYPATLVITGDHDDRVVPGHSFKFAAALQAAQGGPAPALIRVDTRSGHGAGKPTAKVIDEWADTWAFLVRALDIPLPS